MRLPYPRKCCPSVPESVYPDHSNDTGNESPKTKAEIKEIRKRRCYSHRVRNFDNDTFTTAG